MKLFYFFEKIKLELNQNDRKKDTKKTTLQKNGGKLPGCACISLCNTCNLQLAMQISPGIRNCNFRLSGDSSGRASPCAMASTGHSLPKDLVAGKNILPHHPKMVQRNPFLHIWAKERDWTTKHSPQSLILRASPKQAKMGDSKTCKIKKNQILEFHHLNSN